LQPHYSELLKQSVNADDVVHIVRPVDLEKKNITRQNPVNTWIWKADHVTEAVLFISDHYNWDAAGVVVDSATGRRASVQAAYNDSSAVFHQAVSFGQQALRWLSNELPGVPYPYPAMTAVEGFAGIEYPMMVSVGSFRTNDKWLFKAEMDHEIAHTYFPFYMGINESRYAFMDEGWAMIFQYLMSLAREDKNPQADMDFQWVYSLLKNTITKPTQEDQIPIIEVNRSGDIAYFENAYTKPLWAYMALKDLLGDALFKEYLQGYMIRWHGKHPMPWDFFYSFNDLSGKNLNWFWHSWFFSHGYNDLAIGNVIKNTSGYDVELNNMGGFVSPFDLKIKYKDGAMDSLHKTPIVWRENQNKATIHVDTKKSIQSLTIDTGIWLDANGKDNVWEGGNN